LLPVAVFGGAILGAVVVNQFGFAGPQSWVDWQFLTSAHSRNAEDAGLYPAIGGSILLMVAVAVLAFPLGVGAAVYLEEYAPDNRLTRFIDVNISNLAGVPSVVYGLLGLGVFVTYLGQPTGTVAIGGATLALLILPIVIISSREAIRSVPDEMRQASYGMGATKWQTVRNVVLPRAFPGILTGTILALGRAIGETAPLIMIGAPNVIFSLPAELGAKVSAMPLQVYAWASLFAGPDFYQKAVPAGVVVLVTVLLAMNSVAIVLRNRYQSEN
jgi:phosphate transport system permease protein